MVFAGLYCLTPGVLDAVKILKPETVIRARRLPSPLALEIETARWPAKDTDGGSSAHSRHEYREPALGAPRIHGELLRLGLDVGQTSIAKYVARRRRPPSRWNTFLRNHADGIASMDFFVRCDRASERRMDRPSALRAIRLDRRRNIRSRSGRYLWRRLHTAPSSDGHSGSADRTTIAMAEQLAERLIGSIRRGTVLTMSLRTAFTGS
jgi:hypothetical protein